MLRNLLHVARQSKNENCVRYGDIACIHTCALAFLVSLLRAFAQDARDCDALFSFPARGNNEGFHCAMLVETSVVASGSSSKEAHWAKARMVPPTVLGLIRALFRPNQCQLLTTRPHTKLSDVAGRN